MKRENIEKKASEVIERIIKPYKGKDKDAIAFIMKTNFVAAAEWRINSVWYDRVEIPNNNTAILAIRKDGSIEKVFFTNIFRWKSLVKICGFIKWAYVKDLIPNTEE